MTTTTNTQFPPPPTEKLREFSKQYHERSCSRLRTNLSLKRLTLGHNGIMLLLCLRQRSHLLYSDLLTSLDAGLVTASYLLARAHVEVTGTCGCLLYYLRQYYQKIITFDKADEKLISLSLGGYSLPNAPNPIRVGTQIEKADKVLQYEGDNLSLKQIYGFLSEYCHPNFSGTRLGVELTEKLSEIIFTKNIAFKPVDLNTIVNGACISCLSLFTVYDEAFTLLEKNEEIPELER